MDKHSKLAFWGKVDISGSNDCWEWNGARNTKGYGNVRIDKKYLKAHRVAWELENFKIPEGYVILHLCDNTSCCNPSHLALGSKKANVQDMILKKRDGFRKNKAIGVRNVNSKLSDKKVNEIRSLYKLKIKNQYELAEMYGVSQPCIGSVLRGKTWGHVDEQL